MKNEEKPRGWIIAIDGPAGAGKSSVAKLLAKKLGFYYLDTGAMYRAVALAALRGGVPLENEEKVLGFLGNFRLELKTEGQRTRVFWNGAEVTDDIRDPAVSRATGPIADHPRVREILVEEQRRLAREAAGSCGGAVLEGRDIGTVVFPDATFKFYLDADPKVRARRRMRDLEAAGNRVVFEEVLQDILRRDEKDRNRPVGALRSAQDAVTFDHSHLTVEESAEELFAYIQKHAPQKNE